MSTDVFISYRRSDRQWAEHVGECLKHRGVSAWYDRMIAPGEDWRDEIVENIKLAKILVILFSDAVNASTELKKELSVADESQTLIIVVRIENVLPKAGYAYELNARNWFDAFDDPLRQLDEIAAIVVEALEKPDDLKSRFAASAEELKRRRRRQLFGHYGRLRNNAFLITALLLISVVQFFAYESSQSAVANMIKGQTDPLIAYAAVAFAVSIGSPLLLIEALRQELSGIGLLIVPCSLLNLLIMVLLIRNVVSWIYAWLLERNA